MMKLQAVLLLSFLPFLSFSQNNLSLSEAVRIGLENNYQIKIGEQSLDIAQRNNTWANTGRYPTINFSLNSNNGYSNQNNPASFLPEINSLRSDWTGAVNLNWTIFDGFKARINKSRLEELQVASEAELAVSVQQTVEAIILAYYHTLIQQEQLDVVKDVLALSKDRIAYQEARKEYGQATTFDLLQTQDAYLNDSTTLLLQQINLENNQRLLNRAMGLKNLSTTYNLTASLEFLAPNYDLANLEQKMFAQNLNLQQLFINRGLAESNQQLQESNRYPAITINPGVTYNLNYSNLNATNQAGESLTGSVNGNAFNGFVNLAVNYPLYDAGARKRATENAKVESLIAELNVEDLKQELSAQLSNTLAVYNNQRRLIELTQNLVANAAQNLDIAQERFKGGLINSFDYRTIQLNYINASQSLLNAYYDLKVTETTLLRLTGGLVGQYTN